MNTRRLLGLGWRAVWGLALAWLAVACAGPAAETGEIAQPDEIAIYAAVIRQLAGPDDTFGGTLEKPILYVVSQTNDAVGDPETAQAAARQFSPEVQAGITATLADLPSEIRWIGDRDEVELDDGGQAVDGGVIITLGNIQPQADGTMHVAGSIYVANLAAGGQTYVLEQQDGVWVVTGNTGTEWIS